MGKIVSFVIFRQLKIPSLKKELLSMLSTMFHVAGPVPNVPTKI